MFRAIVEPVVDEFRAMFREIQESFHQLDNETQRAEMGQYTARHQMDLLDYIDCLLYTSHIFLQFTKTY